MAKWLVDVQVTFGILVECEQWQEAHDEAQMTVQELEAPRHRIVDRVSRVIGIVSKEEVE